MDVKPHSGEVKRQLLHTLRHAYRVEYFLKLYDVGICDPQRPHDLLGVGNKLSLQILLPLSLQHRKEEKFKDKYIMPAVEFHRKYQHHHQMWNLPHYDATDDDMKVGAIDAVCSLREKDRTYLETCTFDGIRERIKKKGDPGNHPRKFYWMNWAIDRMEKSHVPDFNLIDLDYIPNFHLSNRIHSLIVERVKCTKDVLERQGYKL